MRHIKLNETDRLIYEKEIEPYLPEKIFDAHAHTRIDEFYVDVDTSYRLAEQPLLRDVDMSWLKSWWQSLFPSKAVNGLVMGFPAKDCPIDKINLHVSNDVSLPDRFSILIHPKTAAEELERQIQKFKPTGLKPYMLFADIEDYRKAGIMDMISEEQLDVANSHSLCLTLHVSKPRGMADEQNLSDIARLVRDFPNCNFILAHCGRCFLSYYMEETLDRLCVAENLWFDTSAVCDLGVFINLLARYDRSRILFGTDLVTATGFRGKYITMGFAWDACGPDAISSPALPPKPATFAAYENLRTLIQAIRFCKLTEAEINSVFYENSRRLFKQII